MTKDIWFVLNKERGEGIGNLASDLILNFVIDEGAPEFYIENAIDAY